MKVLVLKTVEADALKEKTEQHKASNKLEKISILQ